MARKTSTGASQHMKEQPVKIKIVETLPDGRMTTKNAAAYLGLSEKTLAMMRSKRAGPEFVKRGRVFYFKSDLDHWINQGRVKGWQHR